MVIQALTHSSLLGQLPDEVQEQIKDTLARILTLAGYSANSNTARDSHVASLLRMVIVHRGFVRWLPETVLIAIIKGEIPLNLPHVELGHGAGSYK